VFEPPPLRGEVKFRPRSTPKRFWHCKNRLLGVAARAVPILARDNKKKPFPVDLIE